MIKTSGIDAFKDVISNAKTTVASQQQATDIHKQNSAQALHLTPKPASINKDKDFDMLD
ncbi:MAG: hypothetical protein ACK5AV_06520 [Alphaproteobacteria bacterium]|jgi:hypothetical protein|nr:hypothetical protein [Candidatus Jidaibacter sp.]